MVTITRILWPTDFSECSRRAVPVVQQMARLFEARVDVLHVLAEPPAIAAVGAPQATAGLVDYWSAVDERSHEALVELVEREFPAASYDRHWSTVRGKPAHAIVDYAAEQDVDLIVISTHGETALSRLVFGSVAEKVVRLARCLVLTVPPDDDDD